jgi:hypothetical protein
MARARTLAALTLLACALAACATQDVTAVDESGPGFLLGLWHGFIFPVAWLVSLFMEEAAIYAVPNDGGWYDFGYFLGIVVFGVGARKTHIVYQGGMLRAQVGAGPRPAAGSHTIRRDEEAGR